MNARKAAELLRIDESRVSRLANNVELNGFNPLKLNGLKLEGRWSFNVDEVERFSKLKRSPGRRALQTQMRDAEFHSREMAESGYLNELVAPEQTRAEAVQSFDDETADAFQALLADALARLPRLATFRAGLIHDIEQHQLESRTHDIKSSSWHLHEMEVLQIVLGNLDEALVAESFDET